MKKSAFVLAMMLALSVFTFVGCGNDDGNVNDGGMEDNGAVTEQTDSNDKDNGGGVVDETEKGLDDMGDAARDGAEDLVDDAKDMVDGDDTKSNADNKAKSQQ